MKTIYHYLPKQFIMNSEEYKFFNVFKKLFSDNYSIIPQVHLDDLARPDNQHKKSRLFSLRHINQKSVDFVICKKNSMSPIVAIEIDGISHSNELTIERDKEVKRILEDEAKLPLVRFKNGDHKHSEEIAKKLAEYLN